MQIHMRRMATAVAIALVMLLVGAIAFGLVPNQATAAPASQEIAVRTATLYGPTAVTTGTTYSSAPLTVNGRDLARITNYKAVDVFVSTDAASSGALTVTVQASADATTWTNMTEIVQTFNTTGTLFSNTYTYRVVLSGASATGLIRAPLAGEFMRVRVDAAGSLTPTVKATFR